MLLNDQAKALLRHHSVPLDQIGKPVASTFQAYGDPGTRSLWARAMLRPGERGLGDLIARLLGPVGRAYKRRHLRKQWGVPYSNGSPLLEFYKRQYLRTYGKGCGCDIRQAKLNVLFSANRSLWWGLSGLWNKRL
jgi:hypothetical protein